MARTTTTNQRLATRATATTDELVSRVWNGYGTTSTHLQGRGSSARHELQRRGWTAARIDAAVTALAERHGR